MVNPVGNFMENPVGNFMNQGLLNLKILRKIKFEKLTVLTGQSTAGRHIFFLREINNGKVVSLKS
jgi:hypothetical protein